MCEWVIAHVGSTVRVPRDSHQLVASAIERAKAAVAARQRVRVDRPGDRPGDRPIDGAPAGTPAAAPDERAVERSAASSAPGPGRGSLPGPARLDVAKRLHGDARSKPVTAPPGTAMAARDLDPCPCPGPGPGMTGSPATRIALQALRGRATQVALVLLLIAAAILIVMEAGRRGNERTNDRPPQPVPAPGTGASRGSAHVTKQPPGQPVPAQAVPGQTQAAMEVHAPRGEAVHAPPGEAAHASPGEAPHASPSEAPQTSPGEAVHAPPGELPHAPPGEAPHTPPHEAVHAPPREAVHAPPGEAVHAPPGEAVHAPPQREAEGRARSPAPDPTHRPAQPANPQRDPAARTSRPSAAAAADTSGSLGELDRPTIQRYVNRYLDRIKHCYEQRRLAVPALAGTVQAEFLITPGGGVASSTATGLDAEVAACVARVIKDIEFPRSGDSIDVKYPFHFVPSD